MQTVGSFLGSQVRRDYKPVKELPDVGNIGIELELERGNFKTVPGWELHNDGSLRDGGVEYVFSGAQGGSVALDSILAMGEHLKKNKALPSFRCSTHIHVDSRDLNMLQVAKYVAAYSIMEDVMFDHCDEYRRYSNFCVPFMVSDDLLLKFASNYVRGYDSPGTFQSMGRYPKYSALNVQPLVRFGSIEFRGSHAMTTSEELLGLAQRVLHLKRIVLESKDEESLQDFIERVNKLHPAQVFLQGLKGDLKRDQELSDLCYSNALVVHKAIEAAQKGGHDITEVNPLGGGLRAQEWRADGAIHREPIEARWNVNVRVAGYTMYGLRVPGATVPGRVAKATMSALRQIRGIRQPTVRDLYNLEDWDNLNIARFENYVAGNAQF